jgi:hypothetical protein
MPEVADIFRCYGPAYLAQFGPQLLPSHRRAIADILRCRTPALGGHVFACDQCGHREYTYHSCRNRSCPKCQGQDTEHWLAARRKELLPGPYFHLVFTVPQELRHLIRSQQKALYNLLLRTAAEALMKLAADPHYLGGRIGILAVLHTWTRTLAYHPHVHCLVPGGAVLAEGSWRPARRKYLVPVRALSRLFRGLFRNGLAKRHPDLKVPAALWRKEWVVYCKPTVAGPEQVLNYLGRYVHRIALSNRRIVSIDHGQVTFTYRHTRDAQSRTMTLPAQEFIRRFLQHVLPQRVHKVRYYGLWAPANRQLLRRVQVPLLAQLSPDPAPPVPAGRDTPAVPFAPTRVGDACPVCKTGILHHVGCLPRLGPRAPP